MPLDSELEDAVRSAVRRENQPDAAARTIIAWLKSLSESELSHQDQANHLEAVRDSLSLSEMNDEG